MTRTINYDKLKVPFEDPIDHIGGTPDDIIKLMENIKERYSNCGDISIDLNFYGYDIHSAETEISGWRWETDNEHSSRIRHEEELLKEEELKEEENRKKALEKKQQKKVELQKNLENIQKQLKKLDEQGI